MRPGGYHPAPPKSNAGVITLFALGCAILLGGVIVLIGVSVKGSSSSSAEAGYDDQPTAPPPEPTVTTVPPTTEPPEPTTDAPEPTTETPTTTTETGPQPVNALEDNPLHDDIGLLNFPCGLPTWETSPAGSEAFFTEAMDCFVEGWSDVLTRADLPYEKPGLQFPSGDTWESPCGSVSRQNASAFYCGQNHTIYMPFDGLQTEQYGAMPGVYLAVFAHEWGHAVQGLSGVFGAYWDARYDAGVDSDLGLELSRRSELQAQCMSGMFFGATEAAHGHGGDIDENIVGEAYEDQGRRGDDHMPVPDHGSYERNQAWWYQGYTENRTFQCNTWEVESSAVN